MKPETDTLPPPAPEPLRGERLLKAAVNQILAHPETWNQLSWHCGTQHCIAGWCQVLGRGHQNENAATEAMEDLGISLSERAWLFAGHRTLPEIYRFAENFSAGFDRAGFDRDGFDRDGRDRDGFDRDGRDRAGFDRDGFDRDGRDRAGRDRDGTPLQPFAL